MDSHIGPDGVPAEAGTHLGEERQSLRRWKNPSGKSGRNPDPAGIPALCRLKPAPTWGREAVPSALEKPLRQVRAKPGPGGHSRFVPAEAGTHLGQPGPGRNSRVASRRSIVNEAG